MGRSATPAATIRRQLSVGEIRDRFARPFPRTRAPRKIDEGRCRTPWASTRMSPCASFAARGERLGDSSTFRPHVFCVHPFRVLPLTARVTRRSPMRCPCTSRFPLPRFPHGFGNWTGGPPSGSVFLHHSRQDSGSLRESSTHRGLQPLLVRSEEPAPCLCGLLRQTLPGGRSRTKIASHASLRWSSNASLSLERRNTCRRLAPDLQGGESATARCRWGLARARASRPLAGRKKSTTRGPTSVSPPSASACTIADEASLGGNRNDRVRSLLRPLSSSAPVASAGPHVEVEFPLAGRSSPRTGSHRAFAPTVDHPNLAAGGADWNYQKLPLACGRGATSSPIRECARRSGGSSHPRGGPSLHARLAP